jgi:IMP cyclohydrolase
MRDLIFYDAIRIHDGKGRVIISNGNQTGPIELMLQQLEREERELDFPLAIAHGFVDQKGAEPDSYRTPRIAGILNKDGHSALGIVTKDGLYTEKSLPRNTSGVPGAISYVSTYKGDPLDKNKIVVPGELRIPSGYIGSFDFGSTAQKFADNIFDWIDPDFVVCAAAVIWNPDTQRWDLAVRNLHK